MVLSILENRKHSRSQQTDIVNNTTETNNQTISYIDIS